MPKLYKASNFKYTPFDNFVEGDLEFLNKNDVIIVDKAKDADVIISQNMKYLKPFFWRSIFGKKFLIWTLEPRFDTNFSSQIKKFFGLAKCHIMNVYTGDVFVSNTTFFTGMFGARISLLSKDFTLKSKKTIALMSYYKGVETEPLIRDGKNIDLIALRSKICLVGNKINALDVYGKGWPDNISKEDSRDGAYFYRKKALMGNYHFNLCFENTAMYNYMTEKIWDSILFNCLPIYYGENTNAYELFPENSFIDYSEFDSAEQLFEYISNMSDAEYIERMNKCIEVYNMLCDKRESLIKNGRGKVLENIVLKVKTIVSES